MRGRFQHVEHVLRAGALLLGGFVVFLAARWVFVPADFGVYGFYRAGALEDNRARPIRYAGADTCLVCHGEVGDTRVGSRHAAINCEACHGPMALHASGEIETRPKALNPRLLCLQCHVKAAGKPSTFPQIIPVDHSPEGACTECHKPHHPGFK